MPGKTVKPLQAPKARSPSPRFSDNQSDDSDSSLESNPNKVPDSPTLLPFSQKKDESFDATQDAAPEPPQPMSEDLPPEEVTLQAVARWSEPEVQVIDVNHLYWDTNQSWGQIRPLNEQHVQKYLNQIRENHPRVPVHILVRNLGSGMLHVTPIRRCNYYCSQRTSLQSLAGSTSAKQSSCCTGSTVTSSTSPVTYQQQFQWCMQKFSRVQHQSSCADLQRGTTKNFRCSLLSAALKTFVATWPAPWSARGMILRVDNQA